MAICPVCSKWFSSEFAKAGHLRLSTDNRHVAYTGKKISRKHVKGELNDISRQYIDSLLERLTRMEATLEVMIKLQQQLETITRTLITSSNLEKQTDTTPLEGSSRPEEKLDMPKFSQQLPAIKTKAPIASTKLSKHNNNATLDTTHHLNEKIDTQNKSQPKKNDLVGIRQNR